MKTTVFFAFFVTLYASAASASVYVKCGKTADADKNTVTGFELAMSSEDDNFDGPLKKDVWGLQLKEDKWLKDTPKITAQTIKNGKQTIVEITIKQANSVAGAVGVRYKLIGLYDEQPVLEKYTMGGFAGTLLEGKFQCLGDVD